MDPTAPASDRMIISLVVLGCLAFASYITFFAARSQAPFWVFPLVWGIALLAGILVARSMLPSAEERMVRELLAAPDTARGAAIVTRVRRDGVAETEDLRMTRLRLTLELQSAGPGGRRAELAVKVEDALLANFASGKTVHVLYDPADPGRMAIDRERSPLRVQ